MQITQTSLEFCCGELKKIASSQGIPNLPGKSMQYIDGSNTLLSPRLEPGRLWFATQVDQNGIHINIDGKDEIIGRHRVYMYLDDADNRYVVSSPVYWSDIIDIPSFVQGFNFQQVTATATPTKTTFILSGIDQKSASITSVALPFLATNKPTTLENILTISNGGKISLETKSIYTDKNGNNTTLANGGSIVDNESNNLLSAMKTETESWLGMGTTIVSTLTLGHSDYNLALKSATKTRWYTSTPSPSLTGSRSAPSIKVQGTTATTYTVAYLEDLIPFAERDKLGNDFTTTYIVSSQLKNTDLNTYTPLFTPNDHLLQYVYSSDTINEEINQNLPFVLLSGDTMTGPLTIAHEHSADSSRVTLDYNNITQSLDFTFT